MRVLAPTAIIAATLAHSACGGGSSSIAGPDPGAITITITRQNGAQSFSPNPAAAGGQLVMFRNNDTVAHRVRLNDGSIDTGNISPGGTSAVVRMPLDGTNYHCELHPDMIGAVSGTSGQPPDFVGIYIGVG